MVVAIAGLSRPLAIVMVSSGSLGASGNIAGGTITMVGNSRSVVVTKAGLSRPLANSMMDIQAIMRVGSGDMLMAVTSIVVSIPRLSRPLANTLSASGNIARGTIAVVSNSWAVIAEASFSSDTAQNGKNGDKFNCHGADGPSSVRRMCRC